MKLKSSTSSFVGYKKTSYEDVSVIDDELGLYLVADGSTHPFGSWASNTVCRVIHEIMNTHKKDIKDAGKLEPKVARSKIGGFLIKGIERAASVLFDEIKKDPNKIGVSSTLVAIQFLDDCALLANVGNSRSYLIRDEKPILLTTDHTLYQEMLSSRSWDTEKLNTRFKKTLTRALGVHESIPVTARAIPLNAGDQFILCTDGLSDYISDVGEPLSTLAKGTGVKILSDSLVQFAKEEKSEDNATVVLIAVDDSTSNSLKAERIEERQKIEVLKSVPIFRTMRDSQNDLIKVSSLLSDRFIAAGDEIVRHGDPSNEMFIIVEGRAKVVINDQVISSIEKGGAVGEIGFLNQKRRMATVLAETPLKLLVLNRKDFYNMVQYDKDLLIKFAFGIIEDLSRKVQLGSENLADLKTSMEPMPALKKVA